MVAHWRHERKMFIIRSANMIRFCCFYSFKRSQYRLVDDETSYSMLLCVTRKKPVRGCNVGVDLDLTTSFVIFLSIYLRLNTLSWECSFTRFIANFHYFLVVRAAIEVRTRKWSFYSSWPGLLRNCFIKNLFDQASASTHAVSIKGFLKKNVEFELQDVSRLGCQILHVLT